MERDYLNRYVAERTDTDQSFLPEVELWTEVILQAIDDLDKRTTLAQVRDQRSAREWFDSDADEIGSFVWACQAINVDPNFIRSQVAKKHRLKNRGEIKLRSRARTDADVKLGSVTEIPERSRLRASRSEAA